MKGDKKLGSAPKENSTQWKKNETAIAKNPYLRAQRDRTQGLDGSKVGAISTGVNDQVYKDNFDKIQWAKPEDKEKPKFRMKVNGKYRVSAKN